MFRVQYADTVMTFFQNKFHWFANYSYHIESQRKISHGRHIVNHIIQKRDYNKSCIFSSTYNNSLRT